MPSTSRRETDVQLARVIGDVVVTRKDENLTGLKLLILQPLGADGTATGRTLVAVDSVGAGVGETVFFVRGKDAIVCDQLGHAIHPETTARAEPDIV